jgi:AraC-like DNA-binding protein
VKSDIRRRNIRFGLDRVVSEEDLPRHQHLDAYATIVLAGTFEQYSYAGRQKLVPGDVLVNPTLDCHSNRMISRYLTLIRLPWRHDPTFGGIHRNLPLDAIVRAAARDTTEATGLLEEQLAGKVCIPNSFQDWPDKLAIDLGAKPRLPIAQWARAHGLTREYAWRVFARTFGVAPSRFRLELNARAACLAITRSDASLSKTAADFGFSDQSHMTRAVKGLTGASPARWRNSHLSKTGTTGQLRC